MPSMAAEAGENTSSKGNMHSTNAAIQFAAYGALSCIATPATPCAAPVTASPSATAPALPKNACEAHARTARTAMQ